MAERAQGMLYDKQENPIAAAAGGYALVATATATTEEPWHHWIRNLMGFEHLPDGAIQWARLRLRIRRQDSDVAQARDALKIAYRRGLPFYSLGVKWLTEGLEWFAGRDSQMQSMLENVRRVAWHTNFRQPLTILKVGGTGDV
jgi:hypothetical protein